VASDTLLSRLARLTCYVALAAAAAHLVTVFALMAVRVPYPFEIEWMEGAVVDHVQRVAQGQALYVPPSLEFVPFLYPPLYYGLAALVSFVVGEGFLGLRLVSALSSVGILAVIAAVVYRETGRRDAALVGAGLFAAMYRIGGAWFDVGRVDMLMLFLLVAAVYAARYGQRSTVLVTGLLLGAAFLTKQTAALVATPLVLWMVAARRGQGVGAAIVTFVLAAGGSLLLDAWHDGWYRYYVFELPATFPAQKRRMLNFFLQDLRPVALTAGLGLAAVLGGPDWRTAAFRLAILAGFCGGSMVSRGDDGGYENVLLPAFAGLSLVGAIGFDTVRRALTSGATTMPALGTVWPSLLLIVQFGLLVYNPFDQMPSAQSEAAGRQLVARIAEAPGEVWVPYHGYLATAAGKAPHAHWMAIGDITRFGPPELREPLIREVQEALSGHRFDLVVMSNYPFADFPSLEPAYVRGERAVATPGAFLPLTGSPRRPEWLYVPRRTDAPPLAGASAPTSGPSGRD
jgi:Dolichyl-phosphate-mannose-protein mannosyltransferase